VTQRDTLRDQRSGWRRIDRLSWQHLTGSQINRVAYGMACALEESGRCFGTFVPTTEEYRRLRRVAKAADEIAEGRFSQICMNDSAEEKRIRQLAETMVKCEQTRRFLPPRRSQRALPPRSMQQ
jgi:hypothetical protein